jgi:hypothetical protein
LRLILDLHISGKRVGRALSDAGHDIRATDAEGHIFDAMDDESLLAMAASEERVLVSRNVRDFPRIAGEWARAGRLHAGIIMIPPSIDHAEFGAIVSGVEVLLTDTEQMDWRNCFEWMVRASG